MLNKTLNADSFHKEPSKRLIKGASGQEFHGTG